jgi:hypothetical protein
VKVKENIISRKTKISHLIENMRHWKRRYFMDNVSTFFAGAGCILAGAGMYNSYRGNRTLGTVEQGLACLCFKVALLAQPVMAHSTQQSDENGEWWMGHYFDYRTYPHGHFDCAHGSNTLEHRRMMDNEERRKNLFYNDDICTRGMSNLMQRAGDYLVVCLGNGQKQRHY